MLATVVVFAKTMRGQSTALGDWEGKKMTAKTNRVGALAATAGATVVAVGFLVLMMLVVDMQPAEATFPGRNGKIAYVGWDGHDSEIYIIPVGGGKPVQFTNNHTDDTSPSWEVGSSSSLRP